jgi:hypothetical protein
VRASARWTGVQIGYRRGGLYSYDWLDRLFGFLDRPSATRILPEFQQVAVGDKIPWDGRGTEMAVGVVEPLRALALSYQVGGFMWVWQFGLYQLDEQTHTICYPRHRACAEHAALVAGYADHGAGLVHHDPPFLARSEGASGSATSVRRPNGRCSSYGSDAGACKPLSHERPRSGLARPAWLAPR